MKLTLQKRVHVRLPLLLSNFRTDWLRFIARRPRRVLTTMSHRLARHPKILKDVFV